MLLWILVIIHLILCLIAYLLMKAGALRSTTMIMPPLVFVPVFGFVCLAVLEWETRVHPDTDKEVGIEKLKINDEIYRSILMEEDPAKDLMVPLNEALLINDERTRRELIMDILYHDTGEFVEVLQKAKYNDDVEVVHYATTAMVELQKDYEQELIRRRNAWDERRESDGRLFAYADVLEKYIDSGLLEGNIKRSRQEEYCELLKVMIDRDEKQLGTVRMEPLKKITDCLMELGRSVEAETFADRICSLWPDSEDGYILRLRLGVNNRDIKMIRAAISQIEEKHIYLSADARKTVEFWKEDDGFRKKETA